MRCRGLGFEDGCTQDLSGSQPCKDVVSFDQRECRRLGPDSRLRSDFKEIQSVLACEVGHRHQLSLFPKKIVRKAPNITHVTSRAYDHAAMAYRAQRRQ